MHLEGSLSPQLLFALATRNQIALPSAAEDASFASPEALLDRYTHFTSLDDFLHYYYVGMSALIHAQDFEDLASEYFLRAKADGVVHAEVFFDPQAHTGRGVSYETVRQGFTKACQKAQEQLGISTKLILCFLRHLPVKNGQQTLTEAKHDLLSGALSGIGLDSSEKGNPPGAWRDIYAEAKGCGIKRTAHAGEEGPVEYIREAVTELDVERIDHGIRLADDDDLMSEIAARHLLVTVCPLSNVRLQCVGSVQQLPIRQFLDAGVDFSINSDDPAYFGGYILDNYCAVQEAFELSKDEWGRIAKASVQGSWCDDGRKAAISVQLEEVLEKYARD
ncbi:MAG: hypothetical protein Q9195_003264 [Heterodermia aff. obscurata]